MPIRLSDLNKTKTTIKNDAIYIYSKNPFTPKGKMHRSHYLVCNLLIGIVTNFIDKWAVKNSLYDNSNSLLLILFISLIILIFQLFIVKKRILDITNNNKNSWIYASLYVSIYVLLEIFNTNYRFFMSPFGIYILCKNSYITLETTCKSSIDTTVKTNTVICDNCNKEVKKTKYCSSCGAKLDEVQ